MPWRTRESSTWTWTKSLLARDVLLPARFGSYSGQFEVRGDTGLDYGDFTGDEHEGRSETRVRRWGRTRRLAFVGSPSLPATSPILPVHCAFKMDVSDAQRAGQYPVKHPSDVATGQRNAWHKQNYNTNDIRLRGHIYLLLF